MDPAPAAGCDVTPMFNVAFLWQFVIQIQHFENITFVSVEIAKMQ